MTEKENKINNLITAIVGKVASLISTHNSDNNSHSDIRNAINNISTSGPVTVEKQNEAETGYVATYVIKQNGNQVGSKINIPKDFLVKSGTVETCVFLNQPVGCNVGDKYIDLVINTKVNPETDEHIYIKVTDLIDTYEGDDAGTITITNNKIGLSTSIKNTIDGKVNTSQGSANANKNVVTNASGNITTEAKNNHNHNLKDLNIYADGQGGTNLIEDTQKFNTPLTNVGLREGTYKNCTYRRVNNTSGTNYTDIMFGIPAGTFKHGEKYTLSFWAKGTGEIIVYNYGNTNYIKAKPINCTSGGINATNFSTYHDGNVKFTLTSDWKRYFVTWELNPTSDSTNNASVNKALILRTSAGAHAYWAGVMYERGEIPHDWSPSPKDISREKIAASSTSIADLDSYKKAGFYYNDNNDEAKYIIHCPNSMGTNTPYTNNMAFFLLVEDWEDNASSVKQTLTYYQTGTTFTRTFISGTTQWKPWQVVLTSSNYSDYANKTTIANNLTTTTAGSALDATQGTWLYNNKAAKNHTHNDGDLLYNTQTINNLTSLDTAFVENANRLAFLPPARIQVWTTTDSGSTWNKNIGTDADKTNLVTTESQAFTAGNGSTANYGKNQIRISLAFGDDNVESDIYAQIKKILIRVGTHGAQGTAFNLYVKKYGSDSSYTNIGTYNVSGWTHWNAIPFDKVIGGYANQANANTDNIKEIVLHFVQNNNSTGNLKIYEIKMIGPRSYKTPTNLGKTGHLYGVDAFKNATFPEGIKISLDSNSTDNEATGFVPTAGMVTGIGSIQNFVKTHKSFMGTVNDGSWHNLISVRHRNGGGDGSNYGFYIRTDSNVNNSLIFNKQWGANTWGSERTILDSSNYSSYALPLSGGTLTGNILMSDNNDTSSTTACGHIPFAHTIQDTTKTTREILPTKKSFIGAVISKGTSGNQYDYVISARHRNGGYDGYKYGMYIRAGWSTNGNLLWSESNGGDFGTEKTILDSSNYSTYASPKTHTHGSIANGGTLNSDISSVNKVVVTDSSNNIKTISKLPASAVTHQDISGKADKSSYVACTVTYTNGSTETINFVTR